MWMLLHAKAPIKYKCFLRKNNISLFKVDDFSGLKFCKLYLSSLFLPTSRINVFGRIDAHDKIEDCIDEMINPVNSSDGFTIIGWIKQGNINDQFNNDDSDDRVKSGYFENHLVSICPTNDSVILDNFIFDVSSLSDI